MACSSCCSVPVFSSLWLYLARRRLEPNTPLKFGLGIIQLGLGFAAMYIGARSSRATGIVPMYWLILGYFLHATGELCLSPIGLSMITKLSPKGVTGILMGTWFLAYSFAQYVAALIAQLTGVEAGGSSSIALPKPTETVMVYGAVFGTTRLGGSRGWPTLGVGLALDRAAHARSALASFPSWSVLWPQDRAWCRGCSLTRMRCAASGSRGFLRVPRIEKLGGNVDAHETAFASQKSQPDCAPMSDPTPALPDLPELPEGEPLDPEPVAVAIETARALFRTGEHAEALRWLRRAAERAEESGDDVRALNLARSAADLSTALQSVSPPRASVPVPPPARSSVPPRPRHRRVHPCRRQLRRPGRPRRRQLRRRQFRRRQFRRPRPRRRPASPLPSTPHRVDETIVLLPYDDFSDKTQVDATAPLQRDPLQSRVQISELPAPSLASSRSVTMPSPPSSEPTIANAQYSPVIEVKRPAVRSALRVAVTRDPESPDTWLVRPLAEDQEVPPGCEEALLVTLDPKSRLLQ